MAAKEHHYDVTVTWTGNRGTGTSGYRDYDRDHLIQAGSKPLIEGSSDPAFRGDANRWNPEDLLVAATAACHKLWYLHLCAEAGVQVLDYVDQAHGTMVDGPGPGRFTGIVLRPRITVAAEAQVAQAVALHEAAHAQCFIANSLAVPVTCEPEVMTPP